MSEADNFGTFKYVGWCLVAYSVVFILAALVNSTQAFFLEAAVKSMLIMLVIGGPAVSWLGKTNRKRMDVLESAESARMAATLKQVRQSVRGGGSTQAS
jgi:hypothetical protein